MGLGNDRKKYAYVSLRVQVGEGASKAVDPAFVLSQKDEHGYWIKGEAFQYISGELIDIKRDKYTYQGREVPKLILFMYDEKDDTVYKIECGYNSLTRSVVNSLMTIPDYRDLQILVYKKTLKDKDNKVVPGAVVRFNFHTTPVKADWMIPPEEITAKFQRVMIRGVEEVDSFPADEMVIERGLEVILPKLRSLDTITHKAPVASYHIGDLPPGDLTSDEDSVLDQIRKERSDRKIETEPMNEDMGDDLPF